MLRVLVVAVPTVLPGFQSLPFTLLRLDSQTVVSCFWGRGLRVGGFRQFLSGSVARAL